MNLRVHELVGQLLAERHAQLHLDQIDAGRPADEVGHLAARDPRRALDDEHAAVRMRDQLRECDARLQAERAHGVRRDALRLLELVAVDGRRVDVDPADAEPDAGRPQPVGERQRDRLAGAREHDAVHLDPLDELLEDRLAARRRRERLVQVRSMSSTDSTRKTPRWPPESAGLSTAGKPTSSAARRRSESERTAAKRGCGTPASASRARIATLCVIRCAVSTPMPGQPARLGDRGDDRHGAVGADGQDAVELDACRRLEHGVDVREVDHLRDVGLLQPERVRVAVDRRDAQSQLLRPQDRPALVAPGADEEDGPGHGAMLLGRQRCANELERPLDVDREAGARGARSSPSSTMPRNRPISSIVRSSAIARRRAAAPRGAR